MSRLTVGDVMTKDVVSVRLGTPFKDVVRSMTEHQISAVPVIGGSSQPVGVISEADLLLKLAPLRDRRLPGVFSPPVRWRRFRRARATLAADVMTHEVDTIGPRELVSVAVHRLLGAKRRRLFVVDDDGKVVGVLARRDVMRVFTRSDDELAQAVRREVVRLALWSRAEDAKVSVTDGEVTLSGTLDRRSEKEWAGALAEQVPGVVAVHNQISYRFDDVTSGHAIADR